MKRRVILGLILASALLIGATGDAFCAYCTQTCTTIGNTQFCNTWCF